MTETDLAEESVGHQLSACFFPISARTAGQWNNVEDAQSRPAFCKALVRDAITTMEHERSIKTMRRTNIATRKTLAAKCLACVLALSLLGPAGALAAEADGTTTQAQVSFDAGALTLLSAPALDFGSKTPSPMIEEYSAQTVDNPVRIADLRGTSAGWKLLVALSPFENEGKATLNGATITLDGSDVTGVSGTLSVAPTANTPAILTSDNTSVPLLTAQADEGEGAWVQTFAPEQAILKVYPGSTSQGISVATLTWSLQDAP